jgi:hypothetical protein
MFSYHLSSHRNKPVHYEDHAATIQDYLTYYQGIEREVTQGKAVDGLTPELKAIVEEKQIDAFDSFTRYILSICSPKMRVWDKHPLLQRYFRCLCLITEEKLKSALLTNEVVVNECTSMRDIPLCDALLASDGIFDFLTASTRTQFPDLPLNFNFGTLRSAFEQLRRFGSSGETDMSKCPCIYTKDSAAEFHYLLLTAIAVYKAVLRCLGSPNDAKGVRYTIQDYDGAYMIVHLLWRIAHSAILREHLSVLQTAGLFVIYYTSGTDAMRFTRDGVVDLEDPDVVDEEMTATQLCDKSGLLDVGIAILRWLRLLVSPLTAIETISLSCIRREHENTTFEIQLVDLAPVQCNKFEWGPVLEHALRLDPQLNSCVPEVIEIVDEQAKASLGPALRTHLWEFGGQDFVTETGVPHCELVTATLLRHLVRAIPVEGRGLILEVRSPILLKSQTFQLLDRKEGIEAYRYRGSAVRSAGSTSAVSIPTLVMASGDFT